MSPAMLLAIAALITAVLTPLAGLLLILRPIKATHEAVNSNWTAMAEVVKGAQSAAALAAEAAVKSTELAALQAEHIAELTARLRRESP